MSSHSTEIQEFHVTETFFENPGHCCFFLIDLSSLVSIMQVTVWKKRIEFQSDFENALPKVFPAYHKT